MVQHECESEEEISSLRRMRKGQGVVGRIRCGGWGQGIDGRRRGKGIRGASE